MVKKKVLFIYNGGTIGMVSEARGNQTILVPPKDGKTFEKVCNDILKDFIENLDVSFEVMTTKDSTNMTPKDWEKLIFRIVKAQEKEGYDAVGIAHGTDTLAYTATALALALHGRKPKKSGLKIPVCLTGAQTTLYERGGDGKFNLENLFRTLQVSVDTGIADVLINFWDRVLLGCRALKSSEKDFDAFMSPAYPEVGHIDGLGVHLNTDLLKKAIDAEKGFDVAPKFGRGVIAFELAPGIEPNVVLGFIANGGLSAIILKSLGEGNVCNEGEYNLLPTIERATKEFFVPVFITTKFVGGRAASSIYEVGYEAVKAGGIPCYDQTDVAVDVKVRWLIGNGICSSITDFRKAMETSYAGEVTPQE